MARSSQQPTALDDSVAAPSPACGHATRLKSEDLFRHCREVEIEHQGRVYRLRLTQLNKLILTA